jgi:7-carboxy-7-deazaguanine synthase
VARPVRVPAQQDRQTVIPAQHDIRPRAGADTAERLRVTEVFYSLQGESRTVGWPTVFVRLTGCPLRCGYCDTAYAFKGGAPMTIDDILAAVARHRVRHVTVTGGEPLAQPGCLALLARLCDHSYEVSLETGGAMDIAGVDPRVAKVMDIKTPGSGEAGRNLFGNLAYLERKDQVKFVICDRADFDWSCARIAEHRLAERCEVLLSPCYRRQDPLQLAEWILTDELPVRFQIQLHKYLWGEGPGH